MHVVLRVSTASAVLARTAVVLLRHGLKFKKHELSDDPQDHNAHRLVLLCGGEVKDSEALASALSAIPGVSEVVEIRALEVRRSSDADTPYPGLAPKLRPVAKLIVGNWPHQLVELVGRAEQGMSRKEHPSSLRALGYAVGGQLADSQSRVTLGSLDDVNLALDSLVLPLLRGVAQGRVEENSLHVPMSLFNRSDPLAGMDLVFGAEQEPCHFMSGFIQGALHQVPQLRAMTVNEVRCRRHGDDSCLFRANRK